MIRIPIYNLTLPLCFLFSQLTVSAADQRGPASDLRFQYEILVEETTKPVTTLEELYRENLGALRKKATNDGALDIVLEIERLETALKEGRDVEDVDSNMTEVVRLHGIYVKSRQERLQKIEPILNRLRQEYLKNLEDRVAELTREGNVDEAVKVREVLQRERDGVQKPESPAAAPVFDLETGSFCGTEFGDSEAEIREKMDAAGLPITGESRMSQGKNITQRLGINFRIDEEDRYHENYLLGSEVPLKGGLKLKESTVKDFERILDARAREQNPKQFLIRTKKCELLLIKEKESDDTVFSLMISER